MKKFLAILLSVMLVLAFSTVAFAATITITHDDSYEGGNGTTARVYNAYKIFDADYDTIEGSNTQADKDDFTYSPDAPISYTMATNSPWLTVMQDNDQVWFNVDLAADGSKYIITPVTGAYTDASDVQDFAEFLEANIPNGATATEVTVDGSAATVDPGYYLIVGKDSKDAVTKLALVTTDVELIEKNTYITTSKTTTETSYNVGDTVNYTATVTIPDDTAISQTENGAYVAGHGPIILHDTMDSSLAPVLSSGAVAVTATVDGNTFNGFTVASSSLSDSCTFEITIPVTSSLLGKTITFTYSAEVTSAAAADTALPNTLYGSLNGYNTTPDTVNVYTFDFDFSKVFNGSNDSTLTATFELRTTANDSTTAIPFISDGNGGLVKADSNDTGSSTTITMTNGATMNLVGLEAGTYYLVETSTDTGYNLLDAPYEVTITDTTSDTASPSHTVNNNAAIEIENNAGSVLPSTGGIGTTIFYIVGAILVLGAGILIIAKRRSSATAEQ